MEDFGSDTLKCNIQLPGGPNDEYFILRINPNLACDKHLPEKGRI